MCLLLNFLMGSGATCLQIIAQAIVLLSFTSNREVGLAYLSAARGLGFLGGPILGQIFVNKLGYWESFSIFSAFLLLTLAIAFFALPSSLNIDDNSKNVSERR
jgi:MFS family permease